MGRKNHSKSFFFPYQIEFFSFGGNTKDNLIFFFWLLPEYKFLKFDVYIQIESK